MVPNLAASLPLSLSHTHTLPPLPALAAPLTHCHPFPPWPFASSALDDGLMAFRCPPAHAQQRRVPCRSSDTQAVGRGLALVQDITSNADTLQHTILSQILAQNSNTEYLRSLVALACCGGCADSGDESPLQPHTFKRIAPVTCYEDMQPYIQRIADGDKSPILTALPISELYISSGTSSGVPKLFPATQADSERQTINETAAKSITCRDFGDLDDSKEAKFLFPVPRTWSAGGLLMQAASRSYLGGPRAREYIQQKYTSPIEVVLECEDVRQSTYCQLLCALLQRQEVVSLGALYASGLVHVMHDLKKKWRELVEDIRTGTVNETEVFDPKTRKAVEMQIRGPNPTLAMEVEEECCCQPLWQGILRRLWPQAKYVSCAVTGSMEQYIPMLEFFSGGIPLISTTYAASECMFGVNVTPICSPYEVSYTILPNMAYFEFLPLDAANVDNGEVSIHQSQLVDLVDVKLGQEYEIVVTTFAGLYRFRVGDCLKVTGFYNKTPQFRLMGRKNVVLSVGLDKTEEVSVRKAVCMAKVRHLEAKSGCQLVDYTTYTDILTQPGHYVLFWELKGKTEELSVDSSVMEACCDAIEECLGNDYKRGRESWIGPLEIRVVREGTFQALMEYCIVERGVGVAQYKTPSVVKLPPMVELLNSRVSHCFFASA